MLAQFGNPQPLNPDPGTSGERITYVEFPDGCGTDEAFATVIDPNGVWAAQSSGSPSWVACSDAQLETRLAAHYGCSTMPVPELNA